MPISNCCIRKHILLQLNEKHHFFTALKVVRRAVFFFVFVNIVLLLNVSSTFRFVAFCKCIFEKLKHTQETFLANIPPS